MLTAIIVEETREKNSKLGRPYICVEKGLICVWELLVISSKLKSEGLALIA